MVHRSFSGFTQTGCAKGAIAVLSERAVPVPTSPTLPVTGGRAGSTSCLRRRARGGSGCRGQRSEAARWTTWRITRCAGSAGSECGRRDRTEGVAVVNARAGGDLGVTSPGDYHLVFADREGSTSWGTALRVSGSRTRSRRWQGRQRREKAGRWRPYWAWDGMGLEPIRWEGRGLGSGLYM